MLSIATLRRPGIGGLKLGTLTASADSSTLSGRLRASGALRQSVACDVMRGLGPLHDEGVARILVAR